MLQRLNQILTRRAAPPAQAPVYRILLTRENGDLLTPQEYRRSFENDLARAIGGQSELDDRTLAEAFAVAATAYACSAYRSTTAASIPLVIADTHEQTPLQYFIRKQSSNIVSDTVRSLDLWGRAYLRKRYNTFGTRGYPTALEWVNPVLVTEMPDSAGRLASYRIERVNIWGVAGGTETVPADEVIYMENFDARPGGNGLSKFEAAWRSVMVEQGIITYAAAFFLNNADISGFLSFDEPLTEPEYEEAKQTWKQFKAARNAHRTAVLPAGTRWNNTSAAPKDLALTELNDQQNKKIHAIMEVDPVLTGSEAASDPLGASSTYNAAEVSHIRRVTLPLLTMLILPALNDQWAAKDFGQPYQIAIDHQGIEALTESNLLKSETAISLSSAGLLDYDESRDLMGYAPRPGYLKRDPARASQLWNDGAILLNQYLNLVGLPPDPNGNVRLISGQLIPAERLMELAHSNIQKATAPPPAFPGLQAPLQSHFPLEAPNPPVLAPPRAEIGEPPAYAILSLARDTALIALQDMLKLSLTDTRMEWVAPEDFHVTLVYCPAISEVSLRQVIERFTDDLTHGFLLDTSAIEYFDERNEKKPLTLWVNFNPALNLLQSRLAYQCVVAGGTLAEYSQPNRYNPHITLAYAPDDAAPYYASQTLVLTPQIITFNRDDHQPIKQFYLRSASTPLTIGIDFAENQMLRYCRRALSEYLTRANIAADWMNEKNWFLTLTTIPEWKPNDAATLIRGSDYSDMKKIDLKTGRYVQVGDQVGIALDGDLSTLTRALTLDLEGSHLAQKAPSAWFIPLCRVDNAAVNFEGLEAPVYPLVGNNITVYRGEASYHTWPLRRASTAIKKELLNWQHRAERDKGRGFQPDLLAGLAVTRFIQVALEADILPVDVFDVAGAALSGEFPLRAYSETRQSFMDALTDLVMAGLQDELSRRRFGIVMRALLRQHGQQAFKDGKEEAGNNAPLTENDRDQIRSWTEEQSGYVTGFADELFKLGLGDVEISMRAGMWADVSLDSARILGMVSGGNPNLIRILGTVITEHCPECLALANQVHPASEWIARDLLVGSSKTSCAQGCKCGLFPTDEPERGNWL